jgi:hypothetical protein
MVYAVIARTSVQAEVPLGTLLGDILLDGPLNDRHAYFSRAAVRRS